MKKLLLLLLLVTTLIQAEEFTLMCEGEKRKTVDGKEKSISDGKYFFEVNDEYLLISGHQEKKDLMFHKMENYSEADSEIIFDSKYEKNLSLINASIDTTSFYGECFELRIKGALTINRASTNINISQKIEEVNNCKKRNNIIKFTFNGKCKKQQMAF